MRQGTQNLPELFRILHLLIDDFNLFSDLSGTTESGPEKVDPGEVFHLDIPDMLWELAPGENQTLQGAHEVVKRFNEMPVMKDDALSAIFGQQTEIGIGGQDLEIPDVAAALDEVGQEKRRHRLMTGLHKQVRSMPGKGQGTARLKMGCDMIQILGFPGQFPEVMVMIAGNKNNLLKEFIPFRHDQLNKALKDHGGLILMAQGQFEDVPVQDQGGLLPIPVFRNQMPQTTDEPAHDRTGMKRINLLAGQIGQQAVFFTQVQV